MAERRMFAKTIVTSDAFLDMPPTARCLYFTLAMFADDDGFVNNPKSIMRQVGATTDDMNILIAKKFVLVFESGVIVIKHWKIHNYIQSDRYHPTKYQDEKAELSLDENKAYVQGGTLQIEGDDTTCIHDVSKVDTEVRLGKDSIGKNNTNMFKSEFDELWKLYPRKQGKDKARSSYVKARKDGASFEEVRKGLESYREFVKDTDPKYICMGSTWFNQHRWEDDYDIGRGNKERGGVSSAVGGSRGNSEDYSKIVIPMAEDFFSKK